MTFPFSLFQNEFLKPLSFPELQNKLPLWAEKKDIIKDFGCDWL